MFETRLATRCKTAAGRQVHQVRHRTRDDIQLILDLAKNGDRTDQALCLSIGSRVRVGEAVLEVTPQAHTGCRKFEARFGADAWRFVWLPELKSRSLRGVYMRVVTPGCVGIDDAVAVLG